MQIEVLEFGSLLQKQSILLRDTILRKPLGLQFTPDELEQEHSQIHIAAIENQEVKGILLLNPITATEIKMRQVAVANIDQGKGIGNKLVHFAEEYATNNGYSLLSLHARKEPIAFYTKLNYTVIGNEFLEVGLAHFRMEKRFGN